MKLIRISTAAVAATIQQVASASDGRREAAAFWLGSPENSSVKTITIPAGEGVELYRRSLRMSEDWMNLLGEFCDSSQQVVLGAVHSHPEEAFHSEIDSDGFFHAPDFVSVVVPNYGNTALANADSEWAVYVGLPWGKWRSSRWGTEVLLVEGLPFALRTLRLPK